LNGYVAASNSHRFLPPTHHYRPVPDQGHIRGARSGDGPEAGQSLTSIATIGAMLERGRAGLMEVVMESVTRVDPCARTAMV
jgi:hypothetical protein